jgi:N-acetyl-gamma-glutamylphosphate reductase
MKTALVTGSSGLIGSEMVSFLDDHPAWELRYSLEDILAELVGEPVEASA